jgi:multidrug efflux pump subunit AcrA (membrane-fusion protein)
MSKRRIALAVVLALIATGGVLYAIAAMAPVQPMWSSSAEPPKEKRWQAVAPGRVEACSGHIKVASAVIGVVQKVLVKANDRYLPARP